MLIILLFALTVCAVCVVAARLLRVSLHDVGTLLLLATALHVIAYIARAGVLMHALDLMLALPLFCVGYALLWTRGRA